MIAKEALRGAVIGSKLFNEMEGCIELNETQPNDSDIGIKTIVFLDGERQSTFIYANAKEGYVKRLRQKKGTDMLKSVQGKELETIPGTKEPIKETVKGDVLILFCSDKVLKLLRGDYERE